MINIRNSAGVALVIDPDQHLTLEQAAGWLQDDNLPGAKSYPIEFPIEPNEKFLQSGYRPDAARPNMEFSVTAQFQNVLYRRCTFAYRITDGKGSAYLKIDGGEVFSKLSKLSLKNALATPVLLGTSVGNPLANRMTEIAAMRPGEFPLTFFPVRNELFFESDLDATKVPGFVRQPYVNAWSTNGFKIDTDTVKGYPAVPFFYLSWVLQQLFAKAGYSVAGDFLADREVQRLVILNQTAIATYRIRHADTPSHNVLPYQHLPDLTVGDFLKVIRQRFGLMYTFNSTTQVATLRRFTDVVKSKPKDLTKYIASKKYGIEAPSGRGFSVVDFVDSSDELYRDTKGQTITPVGLVIGGSADSERQEVKLAVGSCQMIYETGFSLTSSKWLIPTVRQPGNMLDPAYKLSDRSLAEDGSLRNPAAFRVISYLGMQPDSVGLSYPQGSSDVRNGRQEVVGTESSALAGRNGLWQSGLRQFYYFRDQTRQITVQLDLPTGVAASLQLHEPVALALSGHARRMYLIEKLQSESPGPSGIMESKLFALSIPDGLELTQDVIDPVVWVEWIASPPILVPGPAFNNYKRTYSVRVWADRAKTTPAIANMVLNVRRKHTTIYNLGSANRRDVYDESLITYRVNGQAQVLEADFLYDFSTLLASPSTEVPNGYFIDLQPDPGDGYNIIL